MDCLVISAKHGLMRSISLPPMPTSHHYRRQLHLIGGGGACALKSSTDKNSLSEADFGWAIGMYKSGASYEEVRSAIYESARSRGKRNPESYATLTAKKAGAILNI